MTMPEIAGYKDFRDGQTYLRKRKIVAILSATAAFTYPFRPDHLILYKDLANKGESKSCSARAFYKWYKYHS